MESLTLVNLASGTLFTMFFRQLSLDQKTLGFEVLRTSRSSWRSLASLNAFLQFPYCVFRERLRSSTSSFKEFAVPHFLLTIISNLIINNKLIYRGIKTLIIDFIKCSRGIKLNSPGINLICCDCFPRAASSNLLLNIIT